VTYKSAKNPKMGSFCSKIRSAEFGKFGNGLWFVKIEFKFDVILTVRRR